MTLLPVVLATREPASDLISGQIDPRSTYSPRLVLISAIGQLADQQTDQHPLQLRRRRPQAMRAALPLLLASLAPSPAAAAAGAPASRGAGDALSPLSLVPRTSVAGVDADAVAAEDAEREARGEPPRFAATNAESVSPPADPQKWEQVGDGVQVWRHRVEVPGGTGTCSSLNFGFGSYHMPVGGELYVSESTGSVACLLGRPGPRPRQMRSWPRLRPRRTRSWLRPRSRRPCPRHCPSRGRRDDLALRPSLCSSSLFSPRAA